MGWLTLHVDEERGVNSLRRRLERHPLIASGLLILLVDLSVTLLGSLTGLPLRIFSVAAVFLLAYRRGLRGGLPGVIILFVLPWIALLSGMASLYPTPPTGQLIVALGLIPLMIVMGIDSDHRRRLTEELHRLAITDGLTGAYNRHYLDRRLRDEMARADRYHLPLSMILLDVDDFKEVNDSYGHHTGDEVLKRLAKAIQDDLRAYDLLARWGGEEFLVALPSTGLEGTLLVAERLRRLVAELELGLEHPVTISLGVGSYRRGETLAEVLKRADAGLYRAKQDGKNLVMRAA